MTFPVRTTQSFSGQIPVRFDGAPGGPLQGEMKFRGVNDFEHATLCRAFGLDQASYYFDLPSSVRGIGSRSSGYGGGQRHGKRILNGFVMLGNRPEPVGKLTILFDGDKFADVDPMSKSDFFNLEHS